MSVDQEQTRDRYSERELTDGQKAVGVSFNPSKMPEVDTFKQSCADLIDTILAAQKTATGQKARNFSIAITEIESGCMRAVKAYTWQY